MVVFLWQLLSICLLKVFSDVQGIIAWSWKWANFFGWSFFISAEEQANFFGWHNFSSLLKVRVISLDDHFLSLLKGKVISSDDHFLSLLKEVDHFLSLLKSEVISLDDHFLSLRCFFFYSFSSCHVWYSWLACDLCLCENPCLLTLV